MTSSLDCQKNVEFEALAPEAACWAAFASYSKPPFLDPTGGSHQRPVEGLPLCQFLLLAAPPCFGYGSCPAVKLPVTCSTFL